ncbi:hypothetical protein KGF54_003689 [Candida jiufengensis]|uniref:uncharacterized protein n=1 Tax=Candida jiufengensis TaxID=497108 RepID=UPI0022241D7E|nr:uncharacterized protein KGF54_003689 [Candida jiufengensis]KAI5952822.1 hypothetical protein KGF54_003689 [Candida jiufengensis]
MAQLTPIRGFTNTPVTKSICLISTIVPILLSILSIKYYVNLSIDPYIIEYHQFWRLITYQMSVINESDYLLIVLLWFQFKVLERFYGSRKYLSVITSFALANAITCLFVMSVGQLLIYYISFTIKVYIFRFGPNSIHYESTILNTVTPGPLGILSSLYVTYGVNIPISYYFKILLKKPTAKEEPLGFGKSSKELNLSNKFPIHILYILLVLNNGTKSIIPCIVGLLIGKLYTFDLLFGTSWLLPKSIFQFFTNPAKKTIQIISSIRYRLFSSSYQPLPSRGERIMSEEPDDNDEVLDETRQQESQIRAETPVRPLGSQFLDTFRH